MTKIRKTKRPMTTGWQCPQCLHFGWIDHRVGDNVHKVIELAVDAHTEDSPDCGVEFDKLQVELH